MFTVKSALHQISFDGCTNIWPENFVMSRSLTASDQILDKIWRILKTEPVLENIIVFFYLKTKFIFYSTVHLDL